MKMNVKLRALVDAFTDLAENTGCSERGTMESLLDIFEPEELAELGYGERMKSYMEEYGTDGEPAVTGRQKTMLLCEHCIQGIQSRGEPLNVGPLVMTIEEAEEKNIRCEWCGELDDLYDCEPAMQPDNAE